MPTSYDVFEPQFDPSYVTASLFWVRGKEKISRRMVSHIVQTTIGEAASPSGGRGRKRIFSLQDIALIVMGTDLLELGLPPARVRACVGAVRRAWDELFPGDFTGGSYKLEMKEKDIRYLVAGYHPEFEITPRTGSRLRDRHFRVEFWDEKTLRQKLRRHHWGPQIVYCVNLILADVMGVVVMEDIYAKVRIEDVEDEE